MKKIAFSVVLVISFVFSLSVGSAQNEVHCGDIVDGEFTKAGQTDEYPIEMSPGDVLEVSGTQIGDYLSYRFVIFSPTGRNMASNFGGPFTPIKTGILSENGTYHINVGDNNSPGLYTIYVGCTLRDGTVIKAGDNASSTPTTGGVTPAVSPFSGVGFPGLAPVDFSSSTFPNLPVITPFKDQVLPDDQRIHGYSFDANGNDKLDLAFIRSSGNLNLGLVVLSPDNKVVFQASLVTSESLTTRFTLPTAGTYTIGVFRIDLLPPDSPQPTAFQVQATLNP